MAYTASALSFMLEHLDKPVVLTGSQIPLSEIRSDGLDNLVTSIIIAADSRHREVLLYFGGRLLRGNRATKMSADDLIAFDSPNFPHLAHAGMQIKYYPAVDQTTRMPSGDPFSLCRFESVPIGVLKIFPGISFPVFENLLTEKLRGIVLEGFGAGNIPDGHSLAPLLHAARERGTVIVVTSQCGKGKVELGAYAASMYLTAAGAVSGLDMTTEAAVAKLYYLFSKYGDADTVKELMERDLCGEISIEE
jgi:L-asparaginase